MKKGYLVKRFEILMKEEQQKLSELNAIIGAKREVKRWLDAFDASDEEIKKPAVQLAPVEGEAVVEEKSVERA